MLRGNPSRRNQLMLLFRVHPHRAFVVHRHCQHANEAPEAGPGGLQSSSIQAGDGITEPYMASTAAATKQ